MKITFIVLCLFTLTVLGVKAQDIIQLSNGKELKAIIIDTSFLEIKARWANSEKTFDIERYRVFSINWSGKETVLYRQDSLIGNNYNEHEMRMFTYGGKDAIEKYKSPMVFPGGLVAGFAGGFIQPYLVQKLGQPADPNQQNPYRLFAKPVLTLIIPVGYAFFAGSRWININKKDVSNPLFLSEETYIEGFERNARGQRVQQAIFGAGLGWLAGLAVSIITSK